MKPRPQPNFAPKNMVVPFEVVETLAPEVARQFIDDPEDLIVLPPAPRCRRCGHTVCPCCGDWCDTLVPDPQEEGELDVCCGIGGNPS